MKFSLFYTIVTVLNLIAFAIVAACLPASVPLHTVHGVVEQVGSPWVFLALPAVSALLSLGVFLANFTAQGRRKTVVSAVIVSLGGIFLSIGWTFMAIAAQPAAFGEKIFFPYATVSALPLSLLLAGGCLFFENKQKIAVLLAGLLSAVCAIVCSCVATFRVDYIAFIVLGVALFASGILLFMRKREGVK